MWTHIKETPVTGEFRAQMASNLGNKLQWNFNRYSSIFIQEKAFENVVCEMASILSRPQCVKALRALTLTEPKCLNCNTICEVDEVNTAFKDALSDELLDGHVEYHSI